MSKRRFAVIGHPIAHTMSPYIHKRLFQFANIDASYEILDIPPEKLAESKKTLETFSGFNVTIPHKQTIIPLLYKIDLPAKIFGSVNTVQVNNSKLTGFTTDGIGCVRALEYSGIFPKESILILGCGGAARAVAFALAETYNIQKITFAVRHPSSENVKNLCNEIASFASTFKKTISAHAISFSDLESDNSLQFSLLLNCTPIGMYPNSIDCPVSPSVLTRCSAVFDAVYNPHETQLVKTAEALNIPVIHGIDMLVWQAVAAEEIWNGCSFNPIDIEKLCLDAAKETTRIFGGKI